MVWSPKTLQHCLGNGYLAHTEGQQHLQHFNLVGVTQKVAGAEAMAMEQLLALSILHLSAANYEPCFTEAGSFLLTDRDAN